MLTLEGHAGPVSALAFSPDGETLAAAVKGGVIRLWVPPANAGVVSLHADTVHALAFSPDGRYLATGGADRLLQVWDLRDRRLAAATGAQPQAVTAAGFVGPGTILYGFGDRAGTFAKQDTLWLMELPAGKTRPSMFGVSHGVRALAAHADRRLAAWVTDRKELRVQDITRPPRPKVPLRHDALAMALAPDARRLAVTSDWEVLLYDVDGWPTRPTTLGRHRARVSALAFGPDGRTLFSGGWDNTVRVWDLDHGTERASFTWPIGNRVTALAVSPDGLRAAAGGDAGPVAVWDLD